MAPRDPFVYITCLAFKSNPGGFPCLSFALLDSVLRQLYGPYLQTGETRCISCPIRLCFASQPLALQHKPDRMTSQPNSTDGNSQASIALPPPERE